jgi:hypothetical protein
MLPTVFVLHSVVLLSLSFLWTNVIKKLDTTWSWKVLTKDNLCPHSISKCSLYNTISHVVHLLYNICKPNKRWYLCCISFLWQFHKWQGLTLEYHSLSQQKGVSKVNVPNIITYSVSLYNSKSAKKLSMLSTVKPAMEIVRTLCGSS